ncbi:MAG: hypothetical protein LW826_00215 [Candidatus Jidaibacter sp.]|nr:hypothetical protein [Candidatus Jidaibacter sp.]
MNKINENQSVSYKNQIMIFGSCTILLMIIMMALFYYQFYTTNQLKDLIHNAERDIKTHVSSDDLRVSTNMVIAKTEEAIAIINSIKDEIDRSVKIDDEKNKLMSQKYHIVLVASLIEKSILKGEVFADDLETLQKFADKKISKEMSVLSSYKYLKQNKITPDNVNTNTAAESIVLSLTNAMLDKKEQIEQDQTWWSKVHRFFAKWFSIEKVDGHLDSKDKHSYAMIAADMLRDNNVEGAYFMLSKLASNKEMAQVLSDLKQLKEALNACKSIKDKVLLDD